MAVCGTLSVDNNEDVAELEDVFNGSDPRKDFSCVSGPFLFSRRDPEFLPLAEEQAGDANVPATVIFEKEGVPYINEDACGCDESAKLDGNFARLVESVVFNSGLP